MTERPTSEERRNLVVLCSAQLLALAGMTSLLPLLPLYLQEIGVSDPAQLRYWTGVLGAAPFAIAVFVTPLWGALADRVGHKPMVVRSVAGIAATAIGMGLARSPVALLGWRGFQGAVSGVFPAAVALLTSWTPEARVGRALAVLQSARAAGALSGPLIGGLLADLFGIRALFFGVGAVVAASALCCALLLREGGESARRTTAAGAPAERPPRWRDLLADPLVLRTLVSIAAFQAMVMASWPTLALYVAEFGVGRQALATTTGLVIFAAGLPTLLLATSWAGIARRFSAPRVFAWALLASGLGSFAVGALSERLWTLVALRMLAGAAMAGVVPLAFQQIGARAPEGARGRMAGIGSTAMLAGNVVGPLAGGWIAVHVSLAATFWIPGLAVAAVGAAVTAAVAAGPALRGGRPE